MPVCDFCSSQAERPKPVENTLGPIDYEAPVEKKDEQAARPWVKVRNFPAQHTEK